ncbi:uncharacterized protein LOC126990621 [Eriocheir sinensis]|uniref:uncharacterized protein LOC126986724 n=1 Tax=Eriocheir sinensis TaxID=95602 RepID=UPI0021C8E6AC|nr:uncharacterized protein LOC126986724 [Eriocheir sinensis]XP_050705261.1 uncharacterized protein LOC126990621 [Eriocheir sinensis]
MARLLLPVMTVALAMVAGAMGQQVGCPSGYSEAQIPTFSLIKASKPELDGFIQDQSFGDLVYNCFLGRNCDQCSQNDAVRQTLTLLPWLFRDCTQNPAVCNKEQRSRAVYIATEINKRYSSQYQEILALFNSS